MVANKWLAGMGTRALCPEMVMIEPASEATPAAPEERQTLICLDQATWDDPAPLHLLRADSLELPFVQLAFSAQQAREAFASPAVDAAFVFATNEVSALNVAAALKRDFPQKQVVLVAEKGSAWLQQRLEVAGIDGCVEPVRFYREVLKRHIQAPIAQKENDENREEIPDESSIGEIAQIQEFVPHADTVPLELYAADALAADSFDDDVDESPSLEEIEEPCLPEPASLPVASSPAHRRAFYVPVVGASGGVGKSTTAFLAALCSAQFGCKTLLIDFDLQFGDMALFSQTEQVVTLDELLVNPRGIRTVEPGPEGFALVAACGQPEQSEQVMEEVLALFDEAASCFDVIVSNGPNFWNDQHMALLERAGKVLFVLDQRLGSARATQKAFDLCMRCGLAASPFLFLLNKCTRQSQLTSMDVTCAVQGCVCKEMPDGGRVVGEYLEARQAPELFEEGNDFTDALRDVMMDILPGCSVLKGLKQPRKSPFSFFSRKKNREEPLCR